MKLKVQKPKGTRDIFGEEGEFYLNLKQKIINFSLLNGFMYIETPIFEDIKTFTLSLGESSDVVSKEMFIIQRKTKEDLYVLRPEGTAAVVRAYFENGFNTLPQPVSLFYLGKMFRYENPQYGRLREHTQWGLEILNTDDYFADFFIIHNLYTFLNNLGLKKFFISLNSIGCQKCRLKYKKILVRYYNKIKNKICLDCQRRLNLNPLRVLDCKDPNDKEYKEKAPNILDYICTNCQNHFQKVLDLIEDFNIPFNIDKNLVRGFDYYERTVFEIFDEEENFAIGGGGRYNLGKIISNQDLPSVGAAIGLERLKIILDKEKITFKIKKPNIFIAFIGEETRKKAFSIYLELQKNGFYPRSNFFKLSLASQLEYANKLNLKYSLILGLQELGKDEIIFKNMETGTQEIIKTKFLSQQLKKMLK
jgi:histidyl-tRNA synthetase